MEVWKYLSLKPAQSQTDWRGIKDQDEDSTNWLPSGSFMIAYSPQGCFCGGETNSTPRADSWRQVASTSSQASEPLNWLPMRSS
jgi:uncharacterized protein (DUF2461 family)